MSHVRTQIRAAVVALLTGLPATGSRVFPSRIRPLSDADLPCLLISTDSERVAVDGVSFGQPLLRELTLTIRGVVKANAALDDALDSIAEQVEPVINDSALGDLVKSCVLQSIEIDIDDSQEKPLGVIAMQYTAQYFTAPEAPGAAL